MSQHPKTALIAVDVQNDFIDGSLGGPGRGEVVVPLVDLALSEQVDLVVASRDWHPEGHCSFADGDPELRDGSWPVHCVQHTPGAALSPSIDFVADVLVDKGTDRDREAYSAFEGDATFGLLSVKLDKLLRDLGVERVIVGGLCTDYCVRATALDAKALGYDTVLALDASAGVDPEASAAAVEEMRDAGVFIMTGTSRRTGGLVVAR